MPDQLYSSYSVINDMPRNSASSTYSESFDKRCSLMERPLPNWLQKDLKATRLVLAALRDAGQMIES